jgi:hypothetical protein
VTLALELRTRSPHKLHARKLREAKTHLTNSRRQTYRNVNDSARCSVPNSPPARTATSRTPRRSPEVFTGLCAAAVREFQQARRSPEKPRSRAGHVRSQNSHRYGTTPEWAATASSSGSRRLLGGCWGSARRRSSGSISRTCSPPAPERRRRALGPQLYGGCCGGAVGWAYGPCWCGTWPA